MQVVIFGKCSCLNYFIVTLLSTLILSCGSSNKTTASDFPSAPLGNTTSQSGLLLLVYRTAPDQPPTRGLSQVKINVTEVITGNTVDGLNWTIVPMMPSMGHGSPSVPAVTPLGLGAYVASNVDLFMPGGWDLDITIDRATDGGVAPINDQATISLDVQ